ncbi:MAG: DUF3877 family protein [Lachnospiraceae bacterium]|nr:DUF3877 family protein [Lachnospiraceae bacterium]
MDKEKLIKNIADQVKEAQIKLGYAKETVRLYYTVPSLNALLGTEFADAETMKGVLQELFASEDERLGQLSFKIHQGRIEVSVPPEGVTYVHEQVEAEPFLVDLIDFFRQHHHCRIKDICSVFERHSPEYVCEKMAEGMDFDYVIYFRDRSIDAYYYCIKAEMGHTIYHRFTREDYMALIR